MNKTVKNSAILLIIASIFLKVAGLLRDIVIAYYFGDSYLADAFLAAFLIPNMLILFIQNGTKDVFIPSYYHYLQQKEEQKYIWNVTLTMVIIGLFVTVIVYSSAPMIVQTFYPSFTDEAKHIAYTVIRLMILVFTLVCLNAIFDSFLDVKQRYQVPVVSQSLIWISMISFTIFFSGNLGVYSLAYGYMVGVLLASIMKILAVKSSFLRSTSLHLDTSIVRRYVITLLPVGFTVMIGQINLAIDSIFAGKYEEGSITYLNYAKSLIHLPQTLIPVIIGTILFPIISKSFSENKMKQFQSTVRDTFQLTLFLALPAVLGMGILLLPIISLVYERGAFDYNASIATATTGYFYLGSALFFSINVVWNKALYTMQKGHYIFRISCLSILLNIALNYLLTKFIGFSGIPLASSIVGIYYTISTWYIYRKLSRGTVGLILKDIIISVVSVSIMILGIFTIQQFSTNYSDVLIVLLQIIIGIFIYFTISFVLKSYSLSFLFNLIKRN